MSVDALLLFVYHFLLTFLGILRLFVFLAVIFSWFRVKNNAVVRFISSVANPVLRLARRITPRTGMIDLSPLVALIALHLIEVLLIRYFPLSL